MTQRSPKLATEPLHRATLGAARLMRDHPPILHHPNMQLVCKIACPPDAPLRGTIGFTRWAAMPLPETAHLAHAAERLEVREQIFDYQRPYRQTPASNGT